MARNVITVLKNSLAGAAVIAALAACATSAPLPGSAAAVAKPPVGCVSATATHLPVRSNECAGVGSTYTRQDLDRTGQVDTPDALRALDPSVRVHGP
jgi:hypothetical protein